MFVHAVCAVHSPAIPRSNILSGHAADNDCMECDNTRGAYIDRLDCPFRRIASASSELALTVLSAKTAVGHRVLNRRMSAVIWHYR